ncbi:MAG TPA: methionyl-tRNA formyltransferase [Phycisphaerae bacterium]|nr:methionyl-tRNA formyltransferase [Phycisphaerae bacterium]
MRVVFFGSGEFGIPTFDSIAFDGHEIAAVVTQPDRARGRGKEPKPTPLKAAALEAGVEVISPERVNSPDVVERIKSYSADLGYVAAFGQKIGTELLSAFPAGMVNLHGSLLPAYRGAAPVQWAVINGDETTGVTVFRLVEKMDAGPILVQRRTAIGADETADELHDRLARIGCDAVRETLKMLERDPKCPGEPQDESRATLAPKLKKSDGFITFDMPVRKLAARICGLWSWPGAQCRFISADGKRDEVVTLARAASYEGRSTATPLTDSLGRVSAVMSVQAADADLAILEIKPSNSRLMSWQDFVNGRRVEPGDRFIPIGVPVAERAE